MNQRRYLAVALAAGEAGGKWYWWQQWHQPAIA